MWGAPFGLRPCKARKPLKIRDVGNDPCVVPLRLKDIFLWGRRFIPPSSVAYAPNCLQFSSPKGKAFLQASFCTARQGDKREPIYTPSSVACGATFPLEGEGYCADFFRFCFEILTSECLKPKMVISKFQMVEALFLKSAEPPKAFPFEGEGGAAGDG